MLFGLNSFTIKIALVVIVLSTATTTWFYIKSLQNEIAAANELRTRLEENIKAQDTLIAGMREDAEKRSDIQRDLIANLNTAQRANTELNRRFNQDSTGRERSFNTVANEQPSATEQMVNRDIRDSLRCNEIVTGSPLTPDERAGKATNTVCPHLFSNNPGVR